jgi:hypothetical protein
MTLDMITKAELVDLLAAVVDGVDGYESETGDLRYWNEEKIERARQLIDQLITSA